MVGSLGMFQGTKTHRKGTDGVTKNHVSQGICTGLNVSPGRVEMFGPRPGRPGETIGKPGEGQGVPSRSPPAWSGQMPSVGGAGRDIAEVLLEAIVGLVGE